MKKDVKEINRLKEEKNKGLCLLVLSIIFLLVGIIFCPLSIINGKFAYASLSAILMYISFALTCVFLGLGLYFVIKNVRLIKKYECKD